MRTHLPTRLIAVAGLSLSLVAMFGCQSSPTRGVSSSFTVSMAAVTEADFAQQHQFYYFPQAQVYRDCDEDRWLWSDDLGETWRSSPTLPAARDVGDEIPYAVFLTLNEPAMEHQAIAAAYPAEFGSLPATATVQGASDFE